MRDHLVTPLHSVIAPTLFHRYFSWLTTWLCVALLSGCASRDIPTRDSMPTATGLSIERALILANAQQALGTPYRFGGNGPDGLDCSGLVEMTYRAAGIQVPRTAHEQYSQLPRVNEARPGDLLFFGSGRKATHVGIYQGERQMIHAPGSGREVASVPLDIDYWQSRFLGAAGPAP
ncbi:MULTISPECIES: C40 family peptidase [Halomonadaceae]|uniref:C40 family peptidase n=1 Tax=Halomonadaceae TaxID=28256 RepID=UPI0015993A4D|nr:MULTISPECIES: C40 family peptidase [Halomonas]QJQ93857.1 C40 family peptidase [Halomonas sp. PA5]